MQLSEELISKKRVKLNINGIVQGVGFRPFIYSLAQKNKLSGYVLNNGSGVIVELEGDYKNIDNFLNEIENSAPPLSRIDYIKTQNIAIQNSKKFNILKSDNSSISTMLSADISICDECKNELNDSSNRRYNYPFINCTNCGPRYTIIQNLPYDRKNTSMSKFKMCLTCKGEYEDIKDRRYHAQPVSCVDCGPKLTLFRIDNKKELYNQEAINKICDVIKDCEIVAIKGMGGFHIVCDARDENTIKRLRKNKHRPTKPLAVMFKDIQQIKEVCYLSKKDEDLILSKERPIVILKKKPSSIIAVSIAPNIDKIGVFLPYTPLHHIILNRLNFPIVATSANLSDEPIITDEKEIFFKLSHILKTVLSYDREIVNACDDSVIMSVGEDDVFLRMARGYAPKSFYIREKISKKILALGANQKSTISLAFDNNILISAHIGDLNSLDAFEYFLKTLKSLKRVYKFEPDIIVCDKHPLYESTKYAKEYIKKYTDIELIQVQHHYAHALACMAEHSLDEDVLAFCFDGTGYGDDGNIWGSEVFIANTKTYKRVYHLKEFPLLGGEKAVKEPKRVALALLLQSLTCKEVKELDHTLIKSFSKEQLNTLCQMYKQNINSPKTSSLGRLFDGVYALCGYLDDLAYEGESGLILESLSENSHTLQTYSYTIDKETIEYSKMISEILQEKNRDDIAKKFILTISKIVIDISQKYPDLPVVLSGGVFQNRVLLMQVSKELKKLSRRYYIQNCTPVNDGGISLGQAYFAIKKG
jgi:hydrogenase maturation protein HypF